MTQANSIGIWMDHSSAHLMEFNNDTIETKIVESKFTHQAKEESLNKGELQMHNREQHQQSEYYRNLAATIRNYKNVMLFGPTDAKVELFNILRNDNRFADIHIEVKQSDKMTTKQEHAFVKEHFSKKVI